MSLPTPSINTLALCCYPGKNLYVNHMGQGRAILGSKVPVASELTKKKNPSLCIFGAGSGALL